MVFFILSYMEDGILRFDEEKKKYLYWGLTIVSSVTIIILIGYTIFNLPVVIGAIGKFFKIIMPVVNGFVIAYLLSPLIDGIERIILNEKTKKWIYKDRKNGGEISQAKKARVHKRLRVYSIVIVYAFVIWLFYLFFSFVIPEVVKSIENIVNQFPEYSENFINWINTMLMKYPQLEEKFQELLTEHQDDINSWVATNIIGRGKDVALGLSNGVFSLVKWIMNLVLGILISIYVINSKELFIGQGKKIIYAIMRRESANAFIHNVRFTNKTFLGFFSGKLIDSFIIGILCYIIMSIMKLPFAPLIAMIVGVTNIIPYFGPFIGAIPSAILILMVDPKQGLYFIIMILLLQQFDGNILGPMIFSQSTGLSAFWVIFAITFFGGLWGVVGMLVGVPLFAVIYTAFSAWIASAIKQRKLPDNTKEYVHVDYIDENGKFVKLPENEVQNIVSRRTFKEILARRKNHDEDDDIAENETAEKNTSAEKSAAVQPSDGNNTKSDSTD